MTTERSNSPAREKLGRGPIASFIRPGKVSFIVGGQWGSEGKGAAAAWSAVELAKQGSRFDIVTTGAGAQAGHTSVHAGRTRVVYHLPTAPLIAREVLGDGGTIYLNAGAIIDPVAFEKELSETPYDGPLFIHPMAAVITDECRELEGLATSSTTKIASTRKGVGAALSQKVMRSGKVAKDHSFLKQFVRNIDLNAQMADGKSVLVEVPQGVSLSLNHSGFYPHTTSRDCIPSSAMGDAGIHPFFYNETMVVLRTFPIRVGNIVEDGQTLGQSGACYPDQHEVSWEELGQKAEITTVTKRVRRVFTFSNRQMLETLSLCRPDHVMLTFVNYLKTNEEVDEIVKSIEDASRALWMPPPNVIYEWGPSTDEAGEFYER